MTADPSDHGVPSARAALPADAPVPLRYAPNSIQRVTGRQVRGIILLAGALLLLLSLLFNPMLPFGSEWFGWGIMGTPVGPIEAVERAPWGDEGILYVVHAAGFFGLFLLAEWLFLLPRGRLSFQTSERRRSRRAAAIGAGFIGMLLTAGLAATIMELSHRWMEWLEAGFTFHRMAFLGLHAFWAGMLFAWAGWAVVFYWYYRDADHRTAVARITRMLLAGTVLELLVSIPAYVRSLQEPDNCYCDKGSYTGLVFGCTALFWLFGPGVYLLAWREKRRWKPKV